MTIHFYFQKVSAAPNSPNKQLNNSILHILDPIHQSLLLKNLQFENISEDSATAMSSDDMSQKSTKKKQREMRQISPKENQRTSVNCRQFNKKKNNINITARKNSNDQLPQQQQHQEVSSESDEMSRSECSSADYRSISSETVSNVPLQQQDLSPAMIHIVQEMTISRTVTSTIAINRAKIRSWSTVSMDNNSKFCDTSSTTTADCNLSNVKKKCKQRIINENFCNEIIDKTIKTIERRRSADRYEKPRSAVDNTVLSNDDNNNNNDGIIMGKLEAATGRKTRSAGGHLMAKRMQRQAKAPPIEQLQVKIPPLKPPRTFASRGGTAHSASPSSSKLNSSNMSATTVAIGDLQCSPVARKLGWVDSIDFQQRLADETTDEWTTAVVSKPLRKPKIGWSPGVQQDHEILEMLNCDVAKLRNLNSSEPRPIAQPQFLAATCPPESIDTVDSPPIHSRNLNRFQAASVYSTPQKQPNPEENSFDSPIVLCHNCMSKNSKKRPSFGKSALNRTKNFLESASKNILNRSGRNLRVSDEDEANNDDEEEPKLIEETPTKSETTAQFNQDSATNSSSKPMIKTLGLQTIESPKRVFERFLASVKRTPPKTPPVKDDAASPPSADKFDFQRVVHSPPRHKDGWKHQLRLTPKRLFNHRRHSVTELSTAPLSTNTYKSYIESDDGFALFMTEYLRKLYIAERNAAAATATDVVQRRRQSMSSEYLDRLSLSKQTVAIVDCHRADDVEPIYSEIEPPIYASVNRQLKKNRSKSLTELSDNEDMPVAHIDLIGSIQNFLEKMSTESGGVRHTLNDPVTIMPKRMEEQLQKSASNRPESWDEIDEIYSRSISSSSGTQTESIYNEVLRGHCINDEIQNSMQMFGGGGTGPPQAQPESDDGADNEKLLHYHQV